MFKKKNIWVCVGVENMDFFLSVLSSSYEVETIECLVYNQQIAYDVNLSDKPKNFYTVTDIFIGEPWNLIISLTKNAHLTLQNEVVILENQHRPRTKIKSMYSQDSPSEATSVRHMHISRELVEECVSFSMKQKTLCASIAKFLA